MKAHELKDTEKINCSCSGCCHEEEEEENSLIISRIIIGAVLFIAAMILTYAVKAPTPVLIAVTAVTYIILGYDVVLTAVKNIFRGEVFDERFLMTVSSLGAFILGEFTEAVAVMLLYQIGEWLSDLAVDHSKDSIKELMNIKPDAAYVLRNGEIIEVNPYDVEIGETVVVKAGERIPTDGVIISGFSTLDLSSLTGESAPADVGVGDKVLSGGVNREGVIHIEVTATAKNSTAEKIMELMENAAENKSKSESFITKFAKRYTPAVVLISALIAFIPPIFLGSWGEWIRRGLVTLVISCPCALVISVPLTFFGGLGKASSCGILVKGGNYLEALANVDTAVFDKTGTLTKGKFVLSGIFPENIDEDTLLETAAAAEAMSNHPIAVSITEAYEKSGKSIDKNEITSVTELAGRGIKAVYKGRAISAGNYAMIREECGEIPENNGDGTCLYIAEDGKYLGSITVTDVIKPDTAKGIEALRKNGVGRIFMLTGDKKSAAEKIAGQLKLDGF